MRNPKRKTNRFMTRGTKLALVALLSGIVAVSLASPLGRADGKHHEDKHHKDKDKDKGDKDHGDKDHCVTYRWDIIHATFTPVTVTPITIDPDGVASAKANDDSMITLTGAGTFRVGHCHGHSEAVTGGGLWETRDTNNAVTANGTYSVSELVSWEEAPGSPIPGTIDHIGDGTLADNRGGLLVLLVQYSDGSTGTLVVSCHLPGAGPPAAPDTVFEGVTATKSYIDYWNRVAPPAPPGDANRTLFHVVSDDEDDDDDD